MKERVTSDKEALLQQKVKEDLVAYYTELSREADKRRMRAEWRVQRIALSSKRQEFLKYERGELSDKMEAKESPRHFYKGPSTMSEGHGIGTMTVKNVQQELFSPVLTGDLSSSPVEVNSPHSNGKQRRTWAERSPGSGDVDFQLHSRKRWISSPISLETISEKFCDRQTEHSSVNSSLDTCDDPQISGNNVESRPTLLFGDTFVKQDKEQSFVSLSLAPEPVFNQQRSNITSMSCTLSRGAEQPSIAQDLIYYRNPASEVQPHLVSGDETPHLVSSRGHESPSVAQDIIYCREADDVTEVSL